MQRLTSTERLTYRVGNLYFELSDKNYISIYKIYKGRSYRLKGLKGYNLWDDRANTRKIPYTREAFVEYIDAQLAEQSL